MDHRSHVYKKTGGNLERIRQRTRQNESNLRKKRREQLINRKRFRHDSGGVAEPGPDELTLEQVVEATTLFMKDVESRKATLKLLRQAFAQGTLFVDAFLGVDNTLQTLVGCLTSQDVDLQLESVWCFTNMSAGVHDHVLSVVKAAAPYLITYLSSTHPKLQDQCAWCLGNLAGDSDECRDLLKAQGLIQALLPLIKPCTEITLPLRENIGDKSTDNLKSVLSWLKDIPTLTDEQLTDLHITMHDFEVALRLVQPSAKREGFATVPGVTWDDIGALHDIRKELQMAILAPVRYRHQFESLGLTKPAGILLYGPPGCGKTLLAKAIANESGINFISVKGPELLNMYVGESERAVRQVFQRASNSSPCVIFFDELDSLCPRRSNSGEGGSSVRVVNQMLTEMDGLEERRSVFLMAATNRVDIIDPAILRPGRLDKVLYVGLPSVDDRLDILNTITKAGTKPQLAEDVSLADVAQKCSNFTGADLAAVVREASVSALDDLIGMTSFSEVGQVPICSQVQVQLQHFTRALGKMKPSASTKWLTHEAAEKRKAVDDSHTAS